MIDRDEIDRHNRMSQRTQKLFALFFKVPRRSEIQQIPRILEQSNRFLVPYKEIDLAAFAWGEGSTVLLVHGWRCHAAELGSFVWPIVKAGYRVVAFDAPGHGRTEGSQSNLFEFAEAIQSIAAYEGKLHTIIAHSLGAASTTFSLSQGLLVNKVVYLSPLCWLYDSVNSFFQRLKVEEETRKEFIDLFEMKFGRDVWEITSGDKNARNLRISALIFHDFDDQEIPYEHGAALAQAWPNARLVKTLGLGHQQICLDQQVIEQTVNFISS